MEPKNKSDPTIEDLMLAHSVANLCRLLHAKEKELKTLQTQKQNTLQQLTGSKPSQKLTLQKELASIANNEAHLRRQVHNLRASLEAIQLQCGIEHYPADFGTPKHPSLLDTLRKNRKERDTDRER